MPRRADIGFETAAGKYSTRLRGDTARVTTGAPARTVASLRHSTHAHGRYWESSRLSGSKSVYSARGVLLGILIYCGCSSGKATLPILRAAQSTDGEPLERHRKRSIQFRCVSWDTSIGGKGVGGCRSTIPYLHSTARLEFRNRANV